MTQKKQRWTKGAIVKIPLDTNLWTYGILLESPMVEIKNIRTSKDIDEREIVNSEKLFRQAMYSDVITSGKWKKIAKIKLSGDLLKEEPQYVQDSISGELFLYHSQYADTDYMQSCRLEDITGLEPATVAEENHVIDRIKSEMSGKDDPWKIEVDIDLYEKFLNGR